jgi:hypothetical protein
MSSDTSDKAPDAAYDEVSEGGALPPLDFTTFVLSLATSALVSLGEVKSDPPEDRINLPLARQTIDTIAMLQDKTKGNLTGEEERLLNQVLFDLRMKFVEVAQRHKK